MRLAAKKKMILIILYSNLVSVVLIILNIRLEESKVRFSRLRFPGLAGQKHYIFSYFVLFSHYTIGVRETESEGQKTVRIKGRENN